MNNTIIIFIISTIILIIIVSYAIITYGSENTIISTPSASTPSASTPSASTPSASTKKSPIIPVPGTNVPGCTYCGMGFYLCDNKMLSTFRIPTDPIDPPEIIGDYAMYYRENQYFALHPDAKPQCPKINSYAIKNNTSGKCYTMSDPKMFGDCVNNEWIFDVSGKDTRISYNPSMKIPEYPEPNIPNFPKIIRPDRICLMPINHEGKTIIYPINCTPDGETFWNYKNNSIINRNTKLCLTETNNTSDSILQVCNDNDPRQKWTAV